MSSFIICFNICRSEKNIEENDKIIETMISYLWIARRIMPHIKTVTTKVATKLPTAAYTAVYLVADCDVTGKHENNIKGINCLSFPHTRVHPDLQWGSCCWIICLVLKRLLFFLLSFISLVIVLFVLPRITASDYTFVIFKLYKTISVRYRTPVCISRVSV